MAQLKTQPKVPGDPAAPNAALTPVDGAPSPFDLDELRQGRLTPAVWSLLERDFDRGLEHLATRIDGGREKALSSLAVGSVPKPRRIRFAALWFDAVLVVGVGLALFLIIRNWDRVDTPAPSLVVNPSGLAGFQRAATREFQATDPAALGTIQLAFGVAEFDTAEHADEAMTTLRNRLLETPADPAAADFSSLRSLDLETIRDDTTALAGEAEVAGVSLDMAFLIIRDRRYLFVMQGAGMEADPLTNLHRVARCRLAADCDVAGPAPPIVQYTTGGLWDWLPMLEHLPPGFELGAEEERLPPFLAARQ